MEYIGGMARTFLFREAAVHTPIRILLVDDNPFFLDAVRDYLHLQKEFEVIGEATSGREALEQALQLQPDVILLDLNLGEESAIHLIPVLKEKLPKTRIVVVTIMKPDAYSGIALQNGADAFVHKPAMTQTLIPSIADLYEEP